MKEAMKLALEALKNTTPTGFNMESDKKFFAAIKALEEALAKQEQGEPVAEAYALADKVRTVLDRQACPDAFMRTAWEAVVNNYTTPQQRKPLTDEQIKDIYVKNHWYDMGAFTWGAASVVIRAIEAAHGIAPQQRKPQGYAGVTIWGGDATVTKCFTRIQIERARSPRALVEFAVQECLNELAAHGIAPQGSDK